MKPRPCLVWWDESLEALSALPVEPITPMKLFTYDPTPAPSTPFAEGVTKGYLVIRMYDGEALIADALVMVDGEGMAQFAQTGDFQPTTIVEDE